MSHDGYIDAEEAVQEVETAKKAAALAQSPNSPEASTPATEKDSVATDLAVLENSNGFENMQFDFQNILQMAVAFLTGGNMSFGGLNDRSMGDFTATGVGGAIGQLAEAVGAEISPGAEMVKPDGQVIAYNQPDISALQRGPNMAPGNTPPTQTPGMGPGGA